ncbi:MAG: hypothetical protein K0R15_1550 [Clostridiales bacterium]|jgi:hypothetical protein|nr:hypothetical protein [Clostridiales bacterium]
MKKTLAVLLSLVLVMSIFTACGAKKAKTGLAIITSASHSSKDAGEKDGLAQTDSTAAAVIIDEKGVIKDCVIDVVQTKIKFSTAGEVTTDLATEFVSKMELGADYGMKDASPIGKEWDEQAKALAEYVIGKTIDEVKGIAVTEGYATDKDLTSSVTITISDMLAAVEKAVENAEDLGASVGDELGLGIISTLGHSTKNASEEDGVAQAYSHYGVVTLNEKGKITSSIIDASQTNVSFSKEGIITSDVAAVFNTKVELGDAYAMKGVSAIGKEWYEQAKAFTDYIDGKTIEDVKGIALTEGVPTDKDLTSSVTIDIGYFITVMDKAAANAK